MPALGATARIELPVFAPSTEPNEHANAALDHALTLFESCEEVGRHPTLLAVARMLAPFIKAGLLDAASVMEHVAGAITKSGRRPNHNEVEGAFKWAIPRAEPYEPPSDGSEFQVDTEPPSSTELANRCRNTMRHRFVFPSDCVTGPRRGYIIKHLLAPADVAALVGPPGAGKSILAPHLAYSFGARSSGIRPPH